MKLFSLTVGIIFLLIGVISSIRKFTNPSPLEMRQITAPVWWKLGATRIILIILGIILVVVGIII